MRWRDFDSLAALPAAFFDFPRIVHFIGIGGIGMSALALLLQARGHQVSGSDATESIQLDKLRQSGIRVALGHAADNLKLFDVPAEAIVFSSAITADNPEMAGAAAQHVPCWHRSQLLAYFVNRAKVAIAVSGTHGKSTTSALIAHILAECGRNPTAILGAVYPPFESNVRIGDPDLVVVEADESDGSFTLLHPTITVVTNVEPEHLENYDSSETELWRAFRQFAAQTRGGGIVLNAEDAHLVSSLTVAGTPLATYAVDETTPTDLRAANLRVQSGKMLFDLEAGSDRFDGVALGVPGEHNISNALAGLAAARFGGVPLSDAAPTLAGFGGVGRRFQFCGSVRDIAIYDDYAHHPTEVSKTLEAARDFLQRPLLVVFQPHRYSRTQQLGAKFGPSFAAADEVIITELYSAFEQPIEGVSGRIVYDAACASLPEKKIHFVESLEAADALARNLAQPGQAIITMGAGDISGLPRKLLAGLQNGASLWGNGLAAEIRPAEPISRHTTMKVGGPAQWWVDPADENTLAAILETVQRQGLRLQIFGAGSNLVGSDAGFGGVALKLGNAFGYMRVEGRHLIAGGAALLPKLTHFALANRLGGMEWACGIPGAVGGSLFGNAGSRGYMDGQWVGGDCSTYLESAVVFDATGKRRVLQRSDIEFSYRRSSLGGTVIAEATFALTPLSAEKTVEHQKAVKELLKRRRETQPVNAASAGCVWKNPQLPDCGGAGALIEQLGLKGHAIGGAAVSQIHGNFIINTGNATGADVRALMQHVEDTVRQATGISLEREVRLIGD